MLLIGFFAPCLSAQWEESYYDSYRTTLPQVMHPAPSANLVKEHLGYPVSHATGLVDISIPLYEMKVGELSMQLLLKYNSSGIRIQDSPGMVGYGWVLMPDYRIYRTINGKDDLRFPVIKEEIAEDFEQYHIESHSELEKMKKLIAYSSMSLHSADMDDSSVYHQLGIDRMDSEYDFFTLCLPEDHVSFILQKETLSSDFKVILIPEKPYVITPLFDHSSMDYQSLYGFEVLDDQGIKYIFGATGVNDEETRGYLELVRLTSGSYRAYAGWMLRKIVLPNDEETEFTYERYNDSDLFIPGHMTFMEAGEDVWQGKEAPNKGWSSLVFNLPENETDYKDVGSAELQNEHNRNGFPVYECCRLTEIRNSCEKIVFSYETSNQNKALKALSSITCYAQASSQKNKSINFEHQDGFLHSIHISGEGLYRFNYHRQDTTLRNFEKAIDWWGYCNGRYDNYHTFPAYEFSPTQSVFRPGDREPNIYYMTARALKEIVYPTGGTFKINYGNHRINFANGEKIISGLRVESTETFDPVSGKTLTRRYEYEEPHYAFDEQDDIGQGAHYPTGSDFLTTSYIGRILTVEADEVMPGTGVYNDVEVFVSAKSQILHTLSPYAFISSKGPLVWYGKITEYASDGKTEYRYDYKLDNHTQALPGAQHPSYHTAEINSFAYNKPLLLSKTHFDKDGNIQKKEVNKYDVPYTYITSVTCFPTKTLLFADRNSRNTDFAIEFALGGGGMSVGYVKANDMFPSVPPFMYAPYAINTSNIKLKETQIITYDKQGSNYMTETIAYEYDETRPYNIIKKTTTDNRKDQWTERYYYPGQTIPHKQALTSGQQVVLAQLATDNYKTCLIEQTLEKSGKLLLGKLYGYKKTNSRQYKPESVYFYEDGDFSPRIQYLKYDRHGNPACISKDDGANMVVFLWGYAGQYPVAEIHNATYEEVENALGSTFIERLETSVVCTATDFDRLNNLRTQLPYAQITTRTYIPQVGVESTVNPQGTVTRYTYDSTGRLTDIYVVDDERKIVLEEFEYHYVND